MVSKLIPRAVEYRHLPCYFSTILKLQFLLSFKIRDMPKVSTKIINNCNKVVHKYQYLPFGVERAFLAGVFFLVGLFECTKITVGSKLYCVLVNFF